jgi:alkylhydroperoxidase family enzyme
LTRRGLTEDEVQRAIGPLASSGFDDATVAALRLADTMASPHPDVDDAQYAALRRHFDEDEILELAVALSLTTGWQRFIEAFGIRPDRWSPS